jgi:hypothetical protein
MAAWVMCIVALAWKPMGYFDRPTPAERAPRGRKGR